MQQPIDRDAIAGLAPDFAGQCRLLRIFTDAQRADAQALEAAIVAQDSATSARLAHRMTGASRMIGAEALAAICGRIAAAAKASDWKSVGLEQAQIESELTRVHAAVANLIEALAANECARDRQA
jgi:HPt (histidine-containing phosphotransfer) domain-containing protein